MTLTRNEIRKRLAAFAKQWQSAHNEKSQAQTFWLRFYECFGIRAESATIYEQSVKKLGGNQGFIDSFIPGKLIVEHKSKGKDLDAAFNQASDYFLSLHEEERPRYIITSDFARIRLYDLQAGGGYHQCKLSELPKKADWFMFLVEGELADYTEESEADRNAAYTISQFHEALLRANFKGRDLEILLTRLLFCLFAEDTGIFGENGIFRRLMEATRADGSDTGRVLAELFQILNTPEDERQTNLDEALACFAYVNGGLFAETTRIPSFDSELRQQLIACARLDWSGISPAIFGAMFQGVLEEHDVSNPSPAFGTLSPREGRGQGEGSNRKATRRELGAHYTSERNILRVINSLCMDNLRAELNKIKKNKKLLQAFYDKLPALTFFDPACGCGNFLVIGYRELRLLEMDTIEAMSEIGMTNVGRGGLLDVSHLCRVKVSQFYGIEIDQAAAHIAKVALWITDHQMNLEAAERFGTTRPSIPLVDSATIACANSLRLDWNEVIPAAQCSYVLGNPPFVGKQYQTTEQKSDMEFIWGSVKGAGVLDYVTCWYAKAAQYLKHTDHPLPIDGERAGVRGEPKRRDPQLEEKLKIYARELRAASTDAEQCLWHVLRNRNFLGYKFRRQHPVGNYILDFYCAEAALAIELDGGQHAENAVYDANRTNALESLGIRVLRFWNHDVLQQTDAVLSKILALLPLTPTLSPQAGGGSQCACAFVSTNSITQGEQVAILWGHLFAQGINIHFAHRAFQWSNEGKGIAAVHCVIVGFGLNQPQHRTIFDYGDNIKGEPIAIAAHNINPYLVDAPEAVLEKRTSPLSGGIPLIVFGNMPNDGGHLLLSDEEKIDLVSNEPSARQWVRPFLGAEEFINNKQRWCLWLRSIAPGELRTMPEVMRRVQAVKETRLASNRPTTRELASTPMLFGEIRQTDQPYLLIPSVSSENRKFIPIGYMQPNVIASNLVFMLPNATLYHFGILTSTMHNAWMRTVCGRLESRYRYSVGIVYNNFPWPAASSHSSVRPEPVEGSNVHDSTSSARTDKEEKLHAAIEAAAQTILDARALYPGSSLADLYDPLSMPPELVKAHAALDKAVDAAYGYKAGRDDAARVAFLFERYQQLTSLLPAAPTKRTTKKKTP
jgi:very-short-patch-repair endonuclease